MNINNELAHHGILGQKWGVRRYQNPDGSFTAAGKKKYLKDKTEGIRKDISSLKEQRKGVQDKKGKTILSEKDVKSSIEALQKTLAKREAKLSRNWDLTVAKSKIDSLTTTMNRLVYNEATRNKAAKYVVDKNMTISDALKKTKKQAWINSAIVVAAAGTLKTAQFIASKGG